MTMQPFELEDYPNEIAVTKIDSFVEGGAFFLDFSRPLQKLRSCVVLNRWIGPIAALFVPVVHQGESDGEYLISVHRSNPYFQEIKDLWKANYPLTRDLPEREEDGLKIIADFATQFPEDSQ